MTHMSGMAEVKNNRKETIYMFEEFRKWDIWNLDQDMNQLSVLIKRKILVIKQHEHDRSLIGKDKYKESIKWSLDNKRIRHPCSI